MMADVEPSRVQYNLLGNTRLRVSSVGFGAAPLGNVYGSVTQAEADSAVRAALDAGINVIDVSPYYGETRAESVLGQALRGVPHDRYVLATKVGRYGQDRFDFSFDRVLRSVDESLQRLGVDVLDLVQCHDIEFGDLAQVRGEALPALRAARDAGKVRFIGITGLPLFAMETVAREEADLDTVLSYCHLHLSDDSLKVLASTLTERGVGVINASPLAMGLFSGRTLPGWHPAPKILRQAAEAAADFCRRRGVDIAEVALRYALTQGALCGAATTLVGIGSADDARRNAHVADLGPPDDELIQQLQRLLAPVTGLTWQSGKPENNGVIRTDAAD